MIRFILTYKETNIYKDGRSFKTKIIAEKKKSNFDVWERWSNKRLGIKIKEIEVESPEEKIDKMKEAINFFLDWQKQSEVKIQHDVLQTLKDSINEKIKT